MMIKKSRWFLLYIVLALLLLFSIFAVPKIVAGAMSETKGNIVTVQTESPYH